MQDQKYEYRKVEVHTHLGNAFIWERRELSKTKSYEWEVLSPDYWKKLNKIEKKQ